MTKYILKDADLKHHLDAISGGEFSEALKSGNVEFDEDGFATVRFGSSKHENNKTLVTEKFSVFLHKDEVSFQYDPDAWNSFPEVTPPEGVLMRVETKTGRNFCGYYHIYEEGGCWCYNDGILCPKAISESVTRFRPWE